MCETKLSKLPLAMVLCIYAVLIDCKQLWSQELFRFLQFYTLFYILIDINECEVGGANDCHANADCLNIDGSYNCTCNVGYTGTGILCAGILFKNLYEQMMTVLYRVSLNVQCHEWIGAASSATGGYGLFINILVFVFTIVNALLYFLFKQWLSGSFKRYLYHLFCSDNG